MAKKGAPPKYEFVVYKGDDVVCGGTRQEILAMMNITNGTFDRMLQPLNNEESQRLIAVKVSIKEIEAELGCEVSGLF